MNLVSTFDPQSLAGWYRSQLVDNVLPFWLDHGLDREAGGWLTCLDRRGRVFNTDKSVWFQGRGTWTFATAWRRIAPKADWAEAAAVGYQFLKDHCYDKDRRMFFQVTRDGRPLQKRRYWFSESFAVVACAEYFRMTGDPEALDLARSTWKTMVDVYTIPGLAEPKFYADTLPLKGLAGPMIQVVTAQVLREADPGREQLYTDFIAGQIQEIRRDFMDPLVGVLHEHVGIHGQPVEGPKGRLVNPGHAIEASWFIMSEAERTGDKGMMADGLTILDWSMEKGWDVEHGGLLYFVDAGGMPCEALEWDMKLWWPHTEALIALVMAWRITGEPRYRDDFIRMHNYSFSHFSDPEYGEWYGYLHRDGTPSNDLKGNLFKGPFHLPRALLMVMENLEAIARGRQ